MHFDILVEGQTELTVLSILLPKLVGNYCEPHSWTIPQAPWRWPFT